MSRYYEKVKGYYDAGLWDKARVYDAVSNPAQNPWITEAEYEEITGEVYGEVAY